MPTIPKRNFTWGQSLKYEVDMTGAFIKKTHQLPKSCSDPAVDGTQIQQFFSGANVLITGATGFMGKTMVEKLLVSCPRINRLYLVIRAKKGQTMEQRFDTLFNDKVFARLHESVPEFRNKLTAINGDCSQIRLGLSDEDYDTLANTVNVLIHGAATVRFDEKIKTATNINVRGVREMIQFCKNCKNLKSVVHISTAYANCATHLKQVSEKFYAPAYDYKELIKIVDSETSETLDEITSDLIGFWPNTYAFTKQVAEDVVKKEAQDLPITIFRPAIVVATYKEPIRGWCDNIYGPTGIIIGAGTGVLRVMWGNDSNLANIVPVDYAVNGCIAAAWRAAEDFRVKKEKTIYNYVAIPRSPITWEEFSFWNGLYGRKWSTPQSIWHPIFICVHSQFLFLILSFFLHTLPAYIGDFALMMCGKNKMLVKAYNKINKFCAVIAFYNMHSWDFSDNNTLQLWDQLSREDKEIFPFNMADVDWDYHAFHHLLGLRVNLIDDPLETLPEGRLKARRLQILHYSVVAVLSLLLLWTLSTLIGLSFY